ncbi:MAG: energy transducer TonB [Desulfovibrio sp.]|uniref:energy transducer TonB n=1 Tax=Desulfovibrio sp. TaxID=885 RepID=UPI002A3593AC|nr:energy transducer TonB [Desulfovibrio sp.]MDY0259907.1 energy transducer TonB [Desulfovibrio sp.]
MTTLSGIRGVALALSLGMHALLLGGLLLLGREAPPTAVRVYRVTLAEFAPAAGSPPAVSADPTLLAAPAVAEKPAPSPPPPPELAQPKPDARPAKPVPPKPEAKKISPKKSETAIPKEAATPEQPSLPAAQPSPAVPTTTVASAATGTTAGPALQAGATAPAGPQPRTVGGIDAYACDVLDQRPSITRRVEPEYPARAQRMNIQGSVKVRLVVDASGQPRNCEVVNATPDGYFEEAALKAAKNMRFVPGKLKGQPVNTLVELPFIFSLR